MPAFARRVLEVRPPYLLKRSLSLHRLGAQDPTVKLSPTELWRSARLPSGPATLHAEVEAPDRIVAEAWGPGAEALLEAAPRLLGLHDDPRSFEPEHTGVLKLHRRALGLRYSVVPDPLQILIQTILGQRVRWQDAATAYAGLVHAQGTPAPGPHPQLYVLPEPRRLARLPLHEYAVHGIEQQRARIIVRVCQSHRRIQELLTMDYAQAQARLRAFPGVGPWTASNVCSHGLGFTDAVVLGDLKLPHLICFALTGELRGDDETMLELLEPFRPHRGRVIRLISDAGIKPPKLAPRARLGPSPGYKRKR